MVRDLGNKETKVDSGEPILHDQGTQTDDPAEENGYSSSQDHIDLLREYFDTDLVTTLWFQATLQCCLANMDFPLDGQNYGYKGECMESVALDIVENNQPLPPKDTMTRTGT